MPDNDKSHIFGHNHILNMKMGLGCGFFLPIQRDCPEQNFFKGLKYQDILNFKPNKRDFKNLLWTIFSIYT
jgi:hypothetical protein